MAIETGSDHPFQHLSRNVNKVIEQMQKGYYNFRPTDTWAPNVNLYENDTCYLVCVDLAGVDKTKLDLEVTENRLTIRGSRGVPTYDNLPSPETEVTQPGEPRAHLAGNTGRLRVHVMEIDHGPFFREVELPQHVKRDHIAAHYLNGLLWIEIPKE